MKRVLMLLAKGVEPLEMAAFTDVLGWASLIGEEHIELCDAGLDKNITTTFGLQLKPNHLLSELDLNRFDALALPGGFEPSGFYEDALSEDFLEVIRHFSERKQTIASVCVSSLSLGTAGILKGRRATTYHQVGGKRKQQLEATGAQFVDTPLVIDEHIITSTGPGTALEVAFELLTRLTNADCANVVREKMRIPDPSQIWLENPQVNA